MPRTLQGKHVALWFFGNGLRNRLAFEIGARAMGADVSYIPGDLGVHEPLEDIGGYLSNWFDLLVVRAADHGQMLQLGESIPIPLVNARTNRNHPCEIMGDLQYIRRSRGTLEGLKVVFVGKVTNLCMSWFQGACVFGFQVTQVAPDAFLADDSLLTHLSPHASDLISRTSALDAAVQDADVLYTDCWPKQERDGDISDIFGPFRIETRHLAQMNNQGFFLPCPPVTRGEEVSAEVMNHPLCKNRETKDCLLHAQNAIMEHSLG